MGVEVLLYEVGITGTKVEEVEFTSVGPVAVEVKVDSIGTGLVPMPDDEVSVLVLLAYGAVWESGYEGHKSDPDDAVPVDNGKVEGLYVERLLDVPVPVPHDEVSVLVLLAYGAVG